MGDCMFDRLFLIIGGIFLAILSSFKEFSFRDIKEKFNLASFNKPNDSEDFLKTQNKTRFEEFRESFLIYMVNKKAIIILATFILMISILLSFEISAIVLVLISMLYVYVWYYPEIQAQKSYGDLTQELPYALRHMGIELKSGKGLHDSLITIRNSNYGSLSKEFNRVLEEIKYGKSSETALLEMSRRVESEGLSRTVQQIVGTLRVGGNLANSLDIIAKDITFDMHIKLKEYSQKLNSFILIYTFIAILIPIISLIMLMAATTVMGDLVSSDILLVVYSLFFPMLVIFMGIFMKKLEPEI